MRTLLATPWLIRQAIKEDVYCTFARINVHGQEAMEINAWTAGHHLTALDLYHLKPDHPCWKQAEAVMGRQIIPINEESQ